MPEHLWQANPELHDVPHSATNRESRLSMPIVPNALGDGEPKVLFRAEKFELHDQWHSTPKAPNACFSIALQSTPELLPLRAPKSLQPEALLLLTNFLQLAIAKSL